MARRPHLKVSVEPTKVVTTRERVRALKQSEIALKLALAQLPRDSTETVVKHIRQRLVEYLQNVRYTRQKTTHEIVFRVQHLKDPHASVVYVPGGGALRKNVLEQLREIVRANRVQRRPRTYVERLDSYGCPDHGRFYERGLVHHTPGVYLLAQKTRRAKQVFEMKRPSSDISVKHVGIELEFICPAGRNELGSALNEAGLTKYVHVHGDGSVHQHDQRPGEPMEIGVLVEQDKVADVVSRLTEVLHAHKCYVNKTCGMHVHLDMRNRDAQRSFTQLVRAQHVLYAMVPASRKKNEYCRPTRGTVLERQRKSGQRYKGINPVAMSEHRTLEVRIHSGTISALKITNWVQLLLAIVDGPELKYAPRNAKALARKLGLSAELKDYMVKREAHFADPAAAPVAESSTAPIDESHPVNEITLAA